MTDERKPTLVKLFEGAAAGLNALGRSPAFAALVEAEMELRRNKRPADALNVKPDGLIMVEGFEEPIDLVRLRRTIGNMAKSAEVVDRIAYQTGDVDLKTARRAKRHMRILLRNLQALAMLLKSDEVSTPLGDVIDETITADEEMTGASRVWAEATSELDEPGPLNILAFEKMQEAHQIEMAQAFQHFKAAGMHITNARGYIQGGSDADKLLTKAAEEVAAGMVAISIRSQHG